MVFHVNYSITEHSRRFYGPFSLYDMYDRYYKAFIPTFILFLTRKRLKKFNRPSGDHQSISFTCISHRLKLARALIPRRCLSFFSYTCKDCFFFFFLFFFFGIEWRWNQVSYKKSSFVVTLAYKREMRVTHAHWKIRLKKYTSTVKALSFFFFCKSIQFFFFDFLEIIMQRNESTF